MNKISRIWNLLDPTKVNEEALEHRKCPNSFITRKQLEPFQNFPCPLTIQSLNGFLEVMEILDKAKDGARGLGDSM